MPADTTRLAVLIDSDNTTATLTTELLEEIAKFGTPTVKRAYGDWTTPQLAGWKEELLRHTPTAFVAACDRFVYLDLLGDQPSGEKTAPVAPDLKRLLSTAISSTSKDDGWSNLGEVGSYLVKSHAAFDPRDYGHGKLGELVRAEPYVEVKDVAGPSGLNQVWVQVKPARRARG